MTLDGANSWVIDSIEARMEVFFSTASSTVLANIAIDGLDDVDDLEVYPPSNLDLCSQRPLIISGRYKAGFPDTLKARGILADMSDFSIILEVQQENDIPLEKVLAKRQIESYTAQAWFSQDKEFVEKVVKMSIETGVVSEYTHMILLEQEKPGNKQMKDGFCMQGSTESDKNIVVLQHLGLGFGSLIATAENIPPGFGPRLPDQTEMFATTAGNCCLDLCSKCCCMCCIQACSRINNQCSIIITQLCGALTCFGCSCCCD